MFCSGGEFYIERWLEHVNDGASVDLKLVTQMLGIVKEETHSRGLKTGNLKYKEKITCYHFKLQNLA